VLYIHGSYSYLSRQVEIFVKSITTFQYPPVDNLYRPAKLRTRLCYSGPLLQDCGLGRAAKFPQNCGPDRANNFWPMHISKLKDNNTANISACG